MKVVLIGSEGGTHIGGSLLKVPLQLNSNLHFMDHSLAYRGSWLAQKIAYRFFDKRPVSINSFNFNVLRVCNDLKPNFLLTTGCSPLKATTLKRMGEMEIKRLNYLTDDPWNPSHRSNWFLETLPHYDIIFSVRRANMQDLASLGCERVSYLPFGYDASLFHPDQPTPEQRRTYESDLLFVGGADKDRLPYARALIQSGLKVRFYGGYWNRSREIHPYSFGLANPETIRLATACTKVAICLVRRANRDDNCMRSFEIPAVGACMLAEDTQGHREIFGGDGESVSYFKTPDEMMKKAQFLLMHDSERQRLGSAAHNIIFNGKHTYQDRLAYMLGEVASRG